MRLFPLFFVFLFLPAFFNFHFSLSAATSKPTLRRKNMENMEKKDGKMGNSIFFDTCQKGEVNPQPQRARNVEHKRNST